MVTQLNGLPPAVPGEAVAIDSAAVGLVQIGALYGRELSFGTERRGEGAKPGRAHDDVVVDDCDQRSLGYLEPKI